MTVACTIDRFVVRHMPRTHMDVMHRIYYFEIAYGQRSITL